MSAAEAELIIYIIKNVLQVDTRVIGLKLLKIDVIHDICPFIAYIRRPLGRFLQIIFSLLLFSLTCIVI